ncbi:MAG: Asp-tRNA(Asn)/Glu-tRNA(Gln) amidotransferase subunit GatA [Patescibacteria group bacterium]
MIKDEFKAFLEIYPPTSFAGGELRGTRLAGKTIAVKDNILVEGQIASAGSKMLENYRATYDATVIKKLKAAGATLIGRTNMDEFAMGSSTENSAYGPTLNPHDPTRVPGGSSGGSAAAVAAGLAWAALGSDTGGSIRQPAAHCGVVGLKPTYGAVSRFGLIALASSLDQIGTFTTSVTDAETLFEIISGVDENDSTTEEGKRQKAKGKITEKNFRLGVPRKFLATGLDPEVARAFEVSLDKLKQLGHEIVDIEIPHIEQSLPAYYIVLPAEASSNLARFDGMRYGTRIEGKDLLEEYLKTRGELFGPEVRRRIIVGTYVLSAGYYNAYYGQACAVRELIKQSFTDAFTRVDAIATPTTTAPAFKLGEKMADPLQMYLEDVLTVPANIAGIPGLSVPMGKTKTGLPLGFQLMAAPFREDILFALGKIITNE